MVSSVKQKGYTGALANSNLTMTSGSKPKDCTHTSANPLLTMVYSVKQNGYTAVPTNSELIPLYFYFPQTSLQLTLHCTTGIDSTYHSLLYASHTIWIEPILLSLQLLGFSFYLKHVFPFFYYDSNASCPFANLAPYSCRYSLVVYRNPFNIIK